MSSAPTPVIRHLIVCEEVLITSPQRVTLVNLINSIRAGATPFPFMQPQLCAFLQMTEGRGTGDIHIEIAASDTDRPILRSPAHTVTFPPDPLEVVGLTFRIRDCRFPSAGLYWFQCWYNGTMLGQQPLLLR